MKIQLLSCNAAHPDARGITNMLEEITGLGNYDAREMTEILLDGSEVDIEVDDKKLSSAYRALRKLSIDYEIMD